MPPATRLRSRSSVDHIFDLVEDLEEDQLQDLLNELNSTGEHIQVQKGVELFEQQRRLLGDTSKHVLRPTPSFLNQPHEPVDWPRQKPRPVSGSHWRQSMRIVSTPYGNVSRHHTEPISPPLTASPPNSPPLSPPRSAAPGECSPRRSVTAPLPLKTELPRVEIESVLLDSPVSPPRSTEADEDDEQQRPSLAEFGAFTLGEDGAAEATREEKKKKKKQQEDERPVSPGQAVAAPPPPMQQPDFSSRIGTMPLSTLHHEPLESFHDLPRPSTSTGAAASAFKPRSFRRISRPQFLSPVNVPRPDDLAQKLSAYLTGEMQTPPPTMSSSISRRAEEEPTSLEQMLKEPVTTPRSRCIFGRAETEVPSVSGIFQVLNEG